MRLVDDHEIDLIGKGGGAEKLAKHGGEEFFGGDVDDFDDAGIDGFDGFEERSRGERACEHEGG